MLPAGYTVRDGCHNCKHCYVCGPEHICIYGRRGKLPEEWPIKGDEVLEGVNHSLYEKHWRPWHDWISTHWVSPAGICAKWQPTEEA